MWQLWVGASLWLPWGDRVVAAQEKVQWVWKQPLEPEKYLSLLSESFKNGEWTYKPVWAGLGIGWRRKEL